jgi:hypothetical protein
MSTTQPSGRRLDAAGHPNATTPEGGSHRGFMPACSTTRVLETRQPARRALPEREQVAAGRRSGGVEGNARLTASTAVVLLLLLAIEGVTILFLRPLLSVHVFVGMLLIPPVALKLASTGWRFLRYYSGSRPYRLKGPPRLLLRLIVAPAVVASSLLLFGSGVALLVVGPGGGIVLGLHKASFVFWFGAMAVHVLAYALKLPVLASADWRQATRLPSARLRLAALAVVLLAGVVLAAVTIHLDHPWLDWVKSGHVDQ